jgi:glutamyl-tRNA synthetase
MLKALRPLIQNQEAWTEDGLETAARNFAEDQGVKLGRIAQPLRAALTGKTTSPGIFEVMAVLGPDETLSRLDDCLTPQD